MDPLNRQQAPFPPSLWQAIDAAAVRTARNILTGRRYLPMDGPFGPGLTSIEVGNDGYCRQPDASEAALVLGRAVTVPMLRRSFRLSARRLAGFLHHGQPLDLAPVENAAESVATREEDMIYNGVAGFGLDGLRNAPGGAAIVGGNWADLDRALSDVLAGVAALDQAGFRGPYALVLSSRLHTGLFRRYPDTELLQIDHLRRLCTRGVHKAAIDGGLIVDARVGSLMVGQDLMAGYAGTDGVHYELFLSESLVLRLDHPRAVCTIQAEPGNG